MVRAAGIVDFIMPSRRDYSDVVSVVQIPVVLDLLDMMQVIHLCRPEVFTRYGVRSLFAGVISAASSTTSGLESSDSDLDLRELPSSSHSPATDCAYWFSIGGASPGKKSK